MLLSILNRSLKRVFEKLEPNKLPPSAITLYREIVSDNRVLLLQHCGYLVEDVLTIMEMHLKVIRWCSTVLLRAGV